MGIALPKSKIATALLAVVGTILLGAVGSGLWERALGPALDWLTTFVVSTAGSVFSGYLDSVYGRASGDPMAAAGANMFLTFLIGAPMAIAVPGAMLLLEFRRFRRRKAEDPQRSVEALEQRVGRTFSTTVILFVLVCGLYWAKAFEVTYQIRAQNFVERSLDIVAPHLDEAIRLQLRAQYRSIKTAADFYRLEERLRAIASTNSVELPKFEAI